MIYILDFIPSYCPNCGEDTQLNLPGNAPDFNAGASHFCRGCNAKYQKVSTDTILENAEDLKYYYNR